MSFIRPEARAQLWRWREVIVGAVVALFGAWFAIDGLGLLAVMGLVLAVLGGILIFAGYQRGRFRIGTGGPGVVYVEEGQIAYYGPLNGGTLDIAGLRKVELNPDGKPSPHWVLSGGGDAPLHIPANAEGVDALFDAFSVLRDFPTEQMLRYLKAPPAQPVVIWQKEPRRLH